MSVLPPRLPEAYESLLARVEKPGRYVGGEMNAVVKDQAGVRATIALAFPDVYDIGMSYHGFRILYEIVNARDDFAAERVFAPWPDYADALREAELPLTTLETFRPLADLDIIGFSIQHELCLTGILEMLDLAGLPVRASDRTGPFPLVIGGGEGAFSPEPMADFIDAFVLGDGEEAILDILEAVAIAKEQGMERPALLRSLAAIPGVYVPSLYDVSLNADATVAAILPNDDAAPPRVFPRHYDISRDLGPVRPVVPLIRTVQNRTVVEVRRGCVNGCRFCQAGMITRPVRERPVKQVLKIVEQSLENSGDDEVSLLSLSTADHTEIGPLVHALSAELSPRNISITLPSLRISSFDVGLAAEISSVRKSTFTFAPEAGSERLRRIINKPLDEAEFIEIVRQVLRAGWKTLKMYFMVGLPGETDENLDGILRIIAAATSCGKEENVRGMRLNVTLSPFVPKAHTPFQWEGQASPEEIRRRMGYVRGRVGRNVSIKTSPLDSSILEAALARGDRRLGAVIERAWRGGCRLDAWRETFRPETWWLAFEECGLDPAWYAQRPRRDDEMMPFAHLESGPGERYLAAQRDAARAEDATTPDCVNHPCSGCEACKKPKEHVLARDVPADDTAGERSGPVDTGLPPADPSKLHRHPAGASRGPSKHSPQPPMAVQRVRLRFTKVGPLRYISHLDLAALVHRQLRRSGAPIAYSHGFNPQPRIALSPPLPLGFEGRGELADILALEPVDLATLLKALRSMSGPVGLDWLGAENVGLKEPSLQQGIERFDYEITWRGEGGGLLINQETLDAGLARFMASASCPIEIVRKRKVQKRDAREFVVAATVLDPAPVGAAAAMEMSILSREGTTLSPLRILEVICGKETAGDATVRVSRLPLDA